MRLAEEVQRVLRGSDISGMKAEFDLGVAVGEDDSHGKGRLRFKCETFAGGYCR